MSYEKAKKAPMICPVCGVEMNHHAVKVDYSAESSTEEDSIFGGVVEEAHTCPHCGRTELRRAE